MKKNEMIGFRMIMIETEQFAILSETAPSEDSEIKLGTNLVFKADKDNMIVACLAQFMFQSDEKPFIKLNVQCYFAVEPSDWDNLTQEDKTIVIPIGFLRHIAVHTIGTSRGILHSKTESTPFNMFIIPPINVENIVQNDFVVK